MVKGRVALVTGGGTGIGKAIGLQLAKNKARVAIASRNHSHLDAASVEFRSLSLPVLPVQMDVRNKKDVQRAVSEVVAEWGEIHILVNNTSISGLMATHGIKETAALQGITPEEFKTQAVAAVPIKRFLETDEVAGLVCYIASDLARSITGQAINICNGQTMI